MPGRIRIETALYIDCDMAIARTDCGDSPTIDSMHRRLQRVQKPQSIGKSVESKRSGYGNGIGME